MQAPVTDVTQYVPPPKPWSLRLRSDDVFRATLEDVVRLWKVYAAARGDDASQIDLSYVIRRLLLTGADGAFADFGGRPLTEEAWRLVEAKIKAAVKTAQKR